VNGGHPYDVAVLGGGMAGISGALTAVRRGAKVVLFEPGAMGGT
jgi:glycine/D-amino acid oxidase-like deaminating enzyme